MGSTDIRETLFEGCKFYVALEGLPEEDVVQQAKHYIERCGGEFSSTVAGSTHVVAWHRQQPVLADADALSGKTVVSPLWIYACIQAWERLPHGHKLYQPFPGPGIPSVTPALKGCLSGLPNPFRGAALCLMACMGMSVSRNLVPAGAERNTHLIVRDVQEDSPKMLAARVSGMHILNLRWVLDCVLQWHLLPEDAYKENADVSLVMPESPTPDGAVPESDNDSGSLGRPAKPAAWLAAPSRLAPAAPAEAAAAAGDWQQGEEAPRLEGGSIPSSTVGGKAGSGWGSPSVAGRPLPAMAALGRAGQGAQLRGGTALHMSKVKEEQQEPASHSHQAAQQEQEQQQQEPCSKPEAQQLLGSAEARAAGSGDEPRAEPAVRDEAPHSTGAAPASGCAASSAGRSRSLLGGGRAGSMPSMSGSGYGGAGVSQALGQVGAFLNGLAFTETTGLQVVGVAAAVSGSRAQRAAAAGAAAGAEEAAEDDVTPDVSPQKQHTVVVVDEDWPPAEAKLQDTAHSPLRPPVAPAPPAQPQQQEEEDAGGDGSGGPAVAEQQAQQGPAAAAAAEMEEGEGQPPTATRQPGVEHSPSPELPPQREPSPAAGAGPREGKALRRVKAAARGRSRSATPETGGTDSARRRPRKGTAERSMFSQHLPEPSAKEMKALAAAARKDERERAKREAAEAATERGQSGGARGRGRGRGGIRGGSRQATPRLQEEEQAQQAGQAQRAGQQAVPLSPPQPPEEAAPTEAAPSGEMWKERPGPVPLQEAAAAAAAAVPAVGEGQAAANSLQSGPGHQQQDLAAGRGGSQQEQEQGVHPPSHLVGSHHASPSDPTAAAAAETSLAAPAERGAAAAGAPAPAPAGLGPEESALLAANLLGAFDEDSSSEDDEDDESEELVMCTAGEDEHAIMEASEPHGMDEPAPSLGLAGPSSHPSPGPAAASRAGEQQPAAAPAAAAEEQEGAEEARGGLEESGAEQEEGPAAAEPGPEQGAECKAAEPKPPAKRRGAKRPARGEGPAAAEEQSPRSASGRAARGSREDDGGEDLEPKPGGKKRGRPPKAAAAPAATDEGEQAQPSGRKRGRPSKAGAAVAAAEAETEEQPAPTGRKRGRPPKAASTSPAVAEATECGAQPVPSGRKRGRTPKASNAAAAAAEAEAAEQPAPSGKRRGRPPRAAVAAAGDAEVEQPAASGRKRGRPLKKAAAAAAGKAAEDAEEEQQAAPRASGKRRSPATVPAPEQQQPAKRPRSGRAQSAGAGGSGAGAQRGASQRSGSQQQQQQEACFALSGWQTSDQKDLSAVLRRLRVKCIVGNATHSWEPSVTHIVAPRMKRSQKCLAGLAAGNWILGRRYVDACKEAGELLPPDDYELHDAVPPPLVVDAGVAAHWRQRRERLGRRAFEGLKVVVCSELDPGADQGDVCTIVRAGGGEAVPLTKAGKARKGSGSAEGADIVVAHSEAEDPGLQDLVEAGALCVTNAYIVDWLVRPRAALGGHVLLGSEAGAAGGRALAAERRRGSVKGLEVEQHGEEEEPLSPIL